ncbi:MarR family transcriptional regulator [Amnibacterium setariae]|uniref:MarR family transcriptional regulator n=2 Tax=Amnibacterium setariae TaxID=2306585 RepID=A0A3A1TXH8_9MICO|nr:MarR family transcriptional regulator [Amnibacterium setariae]
MLEWLPPALDAPLQQGFGITHFEYGVLFALADADERTLRMSVLAGYANSTLSRLSRAVGRLESRGWVHRSADPTDGRSTLAVLTDEGLRRFELATPVHVRNVRRLVLETTTRSQQKQLREISTRVMRALRASGQWSSAR